MAGTEELDRIISELHHLIPNINVTQNDILNPKHEFVKTFCEMALNYYDKKIGWIATEKEEALVRTATNYYMNLGYGPEIALFVRIHDIRRSIHNSVFTAMDFYKPPKQRTKAFLGVILNFLLYIDNESQNTQQTMQQTMIKIEEFEQLRGEQNVMLERINQKLMSKVKKEEELKILEAELAECNKEYNAMAEEKKKSEALDEKIRTELERYQTVLNEKYDLLNRLTETEKDLWKKVVVPEQLKSIDAMEEQLIKEKNEINSDNHDYATTAKHKQEDCEYYADALHNINGLNFASFHVLNEIKNQQSKIKDIEQKCTNLSAQIKAAEKEMIKIQTKKNDTVGKKQQLMLQKEKFKEGIIKNIENAEIRTEMDLKKLEELEIERKIREEEISRLKKLLKAEVKKKDLLAATFKEQYKRALNIENKHLTNKFHQMLDTVLQECEFTDE